MRYGSVNRVLKITTLGMGMGNIWKAFEKQMERIIYKTFPFITPSTEWEDDRKMETEHERLIRRLNELFDKARQ